MKQNDAITIENTDSQPTDAKQVVGTFAKADVTELSYHKSNELISIQAYRKSLQIKVKEIKNC